MTTTSSTTTTVPTSTSTYTSPGSPAGVGQPDPHPLVIVGHGTRSAAGVAQFADLVERVRRRGAGRIGEAQGGFIELSAPPLTEAVGALVAHGHRSMVALPLVLAAAGHGKGDIPAAMAREQERHPGLTYWYGRPLGPHPLLNDVIEQRIDAVLDGAGRAGTHVALIGRGSTDPDANAEIAKVARLIWEGRGYAGVEPAFISLAEPSVPAVLEKIRRLGAERIVVSPYFLFAGVLPDRIVTQTEVFAGDRPELDVRVADLIGDCDPLADLVLQRYAEALSGDIRMNCDTCAYRIALPGFTDKVGQPQRPHDHPDDQVSHPSHDHHHAHH
jgi:sirohydrochlorin cobaltochelatase